MMFIPAVPTTDIEWRDYVLQTQETLEQDTVALSSSARKSYAELLRRTFLSDDASFVLLNEHLREMCSLTANWDSYGAPVPSFESIENAKQAIGRLRSSQLLPEIVGPSAEGGVSIYFSEGNQKAFIEFLNEGDVLFARYGKDDEPNVKAFSNGLQDLDDQVFQEIREHLRARA